MNENAEQQKFILMTQSPIPALICKLAAPTILSMLTTSFYNMADTYFVGKLGSTSAVGAVGVVFSLMAIIQAFGFFFGHGSGNYMSRQLGMREIKKAEEMSCVGFISALIFGILLAVFGHIFLTPFAKLLGSTDTILPYSKTYMSIILFGAPWMCASLVLNNQLRYQGSAFYAMIGLVSGGIINIILDPIFIFALNMGISGAALATTISQFISFLLLLNGVQRGNNIRIRLKNFKPSIYYYKEMIAGGLPSLARNAIASVAAISLNSCAAQFGDVAVAAMSVVSRVTMFLNSAVIGFGQGFQPVCGYNYGAKLYNRVTEAFWFCVKTATVFIIIVSVFVIWKAPFIITQFSENNAEVIEIGSRALRYQACLFCLNPMIVLSNMILQTIRKPVRATFLALCRQGLFFIPIVMITSRLFGLNGIEISQPLSDIITFIFTVLIQYNVLFKELKQN